MIRFEVKPAVQQINHNDIYQLQDAKEKKILNIDQSRPVRSQSMGKTGWREESEL